MTDTQLHVAIGVPVVANAAMLGIVATLLLSHTSSHLAVIREGIRSLNGRID